MQEDEITASQTALCGAYVAYMETYLRINPERARKDRRINGVKKLVEKRKLICVFCVKMYLYYRFK